MDPWFLVFVAAQFPGMWSRRHAVSSCGRTEPGSHDAPPAWPGWVVRRWYARCKLNTKV